LDSCKLRPAGEPPPELLEIFEDSLPVDKGMGRKPLSERLNVSTIDLTALEDYVP